MEITATGPWHETILWEVPLMACLSELYFKTADTDWSYDNQRGMSISITLWNISVIALEIAYEKAKTLLEANIQFSEFGTRRRRSFYIQDLVVDTLIKASRDLPGKGKVVGTSNVIDKLDVLIWYKHLTLL